ncbi:hypothetical protein U9M48_034061 [Paspalum notatum var. saurae]|uniref:Uncharacterized protein n=1 Tax=Paspalum notatum var. saurae TaxID=547442 RepID=A0AAQ3UBZ9_PASNO
MSRSSNATPKVDIGHLVISMTKQLDYYWPLGELCDEADSSTICRVQQHIREVDKFSYEPLVLAIGPYHHGASALQALEREKLSYLDYILKLNCEKSLLDYLTELNKIAKHARLCYSEDIKMDDEEFLEMLLLDGCFILAALGGTKELFESLQQSSGRDSNCDCNTDEDAQAQMTSYMEEGNGSRAQTSNYGSNQNDGVTDLSQYEHEIGQWFEIFAYHDVLLLENQIPFFVVKKIFELAACQGTVTPFTDEIAKAVETALRWYPKSIQESCRPKEFCHLLHLCHLYFRPTVKKENYHYQVGPQYIDKFLSFGRNYLRIRNHHDDNEHDIRSSTANQQGDQHLNRWRRAAQYLEAGVKFVKMKYDKVEPHSLLDIQFKNGVMKMPCLVVDEFTGGLFRNLIAFEQTCPQYGDDFTAYIVFLSQLISMPEDVTFLGRRKIIEHHLDSDDQVSDLFTMLSKDVVFDFNGNYYLKSLCLTMEAHYQNRINRWMAWLWLNHFSNPWLALAAFATVIVLVCTVVQTVYGILAYVDPPNLWMDLQFTAYPRFLFPAFKHARRCHIIVHHNHIDRYESVPDQFTMFGENVVFEFNDHGSPLSERHQPVDGMAGLWLNHFSNSWLAVGAFVTVIVLVCTFVQSVCGILAYVNPPVDLAAAMVYLLEPDRRSEFRH